MESERVEILYERSFDMLLFDSIGTLMQARKFHEAEEIHQTLARSSVLASLLILEGAANTCIESLDLGSVVLSEIDRLPILSKFDFYLRTNFRNRQLDRGTSAVEALRELKALRDAFVHLKPHRVEWRYQGDCGTAESVRTKNLKIARSPSFLSDDDAVKAMAGAHNFLKYFFKEKCRYGPMRVAALLFSEDKIPTFDGSYAIPAPSRDMKLFLKKIGVDVSYIKLM